MSAQLLAFFRRYPFAIGCSLLAVLLWVGNYFIWTRYKELAAGHQSVQRSGEDMLQALTGHGRISTELGSVKEALAFINLHMIHEGDLPENMGYFYQLETVSRIRLQALNQLSSSPPPPEQPFKTVPFTVRTTGTYRQILRFLRELEAGPRLYKLQNYSLVQDATGGENQQITVDLTLEVLAHP